MKYLPAITGVTLLQFLYKSAKVLGKFDGSIVSFNDYARSKAREIGIDESFLTKDINANLSGGEKKQSEILQLAILKPKFAFLDEIDSGVDIDSLKKVFGALFSLKRQGTGFLLVTHYANILENIKPDKVYVMKNGKISKSGGEELVAEIIKNGYEK